jgi:ketosteroid isomerase-like protein
VNIRTKLFACLSSLALCLASGNIVAHQGDDDEAQSSAALDTEQQAVVNTLEAFAVAFQNANVDAIRTLTLADDGFSHFEGAFVDWSWDSYAGHLAEEMPLFTETRYQVSNVRPETQGGMAFATYDWNMDVVVVSDEFEGGRHPINMNGIATAVLVKSGDDWKIRHMHTARAKALPAEH